MDLNIVKLQNLWWDNPKAIEVDQHLLDIEGKSYKFTPSVIDQVAFSAGDIHIIRGPRQVGKTTTIKLMIKKLLGSGVDAKSIVYISCEAIESFKELQTILVETIENKKGKLYIFLDEISFVTSWQRGILAVANLGLLKNAVVVITGSNARDLKQSSERLPGRRGKGRDFKLYPLSIPEMSKLNCFRKKSPAELLELYIQVGGFPRAISDFVNFGNVTDATYETYRNWIVGDAQKYELRQETLKQILFRISETIATRVTWPVLIENSPVKSHETALHYVEHLQDAFLCTINYCYDIEKHGPAFQKARKIYFVDPLLSVIAMGWRDGITNLFNFLKERLKDPVFKGRFFEGIVVNHFYRQYGGAYFWYSAKQKKEVDILLNEGGEISLFEVKVSNEKPFTVMDKEVQIISPEIFLKYIFSNNLATV